MTIVWPTQKQAEKFYGDPALRGWAKANLVDVPCPWTLFMGKQKLHSIQINKKCAASLYRVLNSVWEKVGKDESAIQTLHYHLYSGSYNYRPMRGGHILSMHAYGCAIDFDDQENQQHSTHHLFKDDSPLILAFKEEGWSWGGDWSAGSIDAMHVQAARVHGDPADLSAIHDPWPIPHVVSPANTDVVATTTGTPEANVAEPTTTIPVIWPDETATPQTHHWWQFWKKKTS